MSPNNRILFNGVLRPKLLSDPFAYCSFTNFDVFTATYSTFF